MQELQIQSLIFVYQIKMNYIFFSFISIILTTNASDKTVNKNLVENLSQNEIEILRKLYKEKNIDGQINNEQTATLSNSSKDDHISSSFSSSTLNYKNQNNFSLVDQNEQANNYSLQSTSTQSSFPPPPLGFYSSFLNRIVLNVNESSNYKTNHSLQSSDFQTQGTERGYYNYYPETSSQFPEQSQQRFLYQGQNMAHDKDNDPSRMMNYSNVVNQIDEVSSSSIVPNLANPVLCHSTFDIEKSIINQGIIRPKAVPGNFSSTTNYQQPNHSSNYTYPQSYENVHKYQNDFNFLQNYPQNICVNDSTFYPRSWNAYENQYQFQQTVYKSNEMQANNFTEQDSSCHENCNLSSDDLSPHSSGDYYDLDKNLSNTSQLQVVEECPINRKNQGSAFEHFTVKNRQMFTSTNDSGTSFSTKSGSNDENLLQFDSFDQIEPKKSQSEDSQTRNKSFSRAHSPKNDMIEPNSRKNQENPSDNTSISENTANSSFNYSQSEPNKSNDKKGVDNIKTQKKQPVSLVRTNKNIIQQQSDDSSSALFSNWCERSFHTDTNDTFYLSKFTLPKFKSKNKSSQSLNPNFLMNSSSNKVKKKARDLSYINKRKNEWAEECEFMTRIIKLFGNGLLLNSEDLNEEIGILEEELQKCNCLEKQLILTTQIISMENENVYKNSFYDYLIKRFEKSTDLLNFSDFFMKRPAQICGQIPFLNLYFHNRIKFLKNNANNEIIPFRLFKTHKFYCVFDYRSLILQQKDMNALCMCSLNCANRNFTLKQHFQSVIYKFFCDEIASKIPETTDNNFIGHERLRRISTRSEYLDKIQSFLDHDDEADNFEIDLFTYISELNIVLISKIYNPSTINVEIQSITKNLLYFLLKNSEIKSVLPEIRVFHQIFNLDKIRLHIESDHQQKIIANSLFWLIQFNYKKKISDSIIQQIRINLIMPIFFSLGADIQFLKLYLFLVFKNDNLMISLILEIYSGSGGHMFLFNEPLLENSCHDHQSCNSGSCSEKPEFVQYVQKKSKTDFLFNRALRNIHREVPLMHYEYDSYRIPLMKILHRIRLEDNSELSFLHLKYIILFAEENQKFKKLIPEISCPSYFESIKSELNKKIQMISNSKLNQNMNYHDQEDTQYHYYKNNSKFKVLHSSNCEDFPCAFNNNSDDDEIDDTNTNQNPFSFDKIIPSDDSSYDHIQDKYQSCDDNQILQQSLEDNQNHNQLSIHSASRVECNVDVAEIEKESDFRLTVSQNQSNSGKKNIKNSVYMMNDTEKLNDFSTIEKKMNDKGLKMQKKTHINVNDQSNCSKKNKRKSIKHTKTQKKLATKININKQSNISIENEDKLADNHIAVEKQSNNATKNKLRQTAQVMKRFVKIAEVTKKNEFQNQSSTTSGTDIDKDLVDDVSVIEKQLDNDKMIQDCFDNSKTEDVAIDSSVQDNKIKKTEKIFINQYKRKPCPVPPVNELRRSKRFKQ